MKWFFLGLPVGFKSHSNDPLDICHPFSTMAWLPFVLAGRRLILIAYDGLWFARSFWSVKGEYMPWHLVGFLSSVQLITIACYHKRNRFGITLKSKGQLIRENVIRPHLLPSLSWHSIYNSTMVISYFKNSCVNKYYLLLFIPIMVFVIIHPYSCSVILYSIWDSFFMSLMLLIQIIFLMSDYCVMFASVVVFEH